MKAIIKQLDDLWGQAVLLRDGCCQICGKTEGLDPHHSLVRRAAQATRWHLLNGIALCRECHTQVHAGKLKAELMVAINRIASPEMQDRIRKQGRGVFKIWEGWCSRQIGYLKRFILAQGAEVITFGKKA